MWWIFEVVEEEDEESVCRTRLLDKLALNDTVP